MLTLLTLCIRYYNIVSKYSCLYIGYLSFRPQSKFQSIAFLPVFSRYLLQSEKHALLNNYYLKLGSHYALRVEKDVRFLRPNASLNLLILLCLELVFPIAKIQSYHIAH